MQFQWRQKIFEISTILLSILTVADNRISRYVNLAYKRKTHQTGENPGTTVNDWGASMKAVDGDMNGDFAADSCTHTGKLARPEWTVSIGNDGRPPNIPVHHVMITNRILAYYRLNNFAVYTVQDKSTDPLQKRHLCYHFRGVFPNGTRLLTCKQRIPKASRVEIKLLKKEEEYLTLCEVAIFDGNPGWYKPGTRDMNSFVDVDYMGRPCAGASVKGGRHCHMVWNGQRLQEPKCLVGKSLEKCTIPPYYNDFEYRTTWGDWGACTATCRGATRQRNEVCIEPAWKGKPCPHAFKGKSDVEQCGNLPPCDGNTQERSNTNPDRILPNETSGKDRMPQGPHIRNDSSVEIWVPMIITASLLALVIGGAGCFLYIHDKKSRRAQKKGRGRADGDKEKKNVLLQFLTGGADENKQLNDNKEEEYLLSDSGSAVSDMSSRRSSRRSRRSHRKKRRKKHRKKKRKHKHKRRSHVTSETDNDINAIMKALGIEDMDPNVDVELVEMDAEDNLNTKCDEIGQQTKQSSDNDIHTEQDGDQSEQSEQGDDQGNINSNDNRMRSIALFPETVNLNNHSSPKTTLEVRPRTGPRSQCLTQKDKGRAGSKHADPGKRDGGLGTTSEPENCQLANKNENEIVSKTVQVTRRGRASLNSLFEFDNNVTESNPPTSKLKLSPQKTTNEHKTPTSTNRLRKNPESKGGSRAKKSKTPLSRKQTITSALPGYGVSAWTTEKRQRDHSRRVKKQIPGYDFPGII